MREQKGGKSRAGQVRIEGETRVGLEVKRRSRNKQSKKHIEGVRKMINTLIVLAWHWLWKSKGILCIYIEYLKQFSLINFLAELLFI